jgi:Concanavalin A-like lectin/glucanases superfamily
LHLLSGIPQAGDRSYIEMLLWEDYRNLRRLLEEHAEANVFVDRQALALDPRMVPQSQLLFDAVLRDGYQVCAVTEGHCLFRKGGTVFPDQPRPLFHLSFSEGRAGNGLGFRPVWLGREFTLELLVKPEAAQVPWATLISNHPGYRDHEGFAVELIIPGVYELVWGDGRLWHHVLEFPLASDHWSYLAIVREGATIKVYVEGNEVACCDVAGLGFKESDMPLGVGNWVNQDRSWHGLIREVRILGYALPAPVIQANRDGIHETDFRR